MALTMTNFARKCRGNSGQKTLISDNFPTKIKNKKTKQNKLKMFKIACLLGFAGLTFGVQFSSASNAIDIDNLESDFKDL